MNFSVSFTFIAILKIIIVFLIFVKSIFGFTLGIVGLGLCFGGVMGVFPSLVMDNFGPKYQGVNYGIIFIGYSTAAFVAPKVTAGISAANNGDFTKAFYVAIAVASAGLILDLVYKKKTTAAKVTTETIQ